MLQNFRDKSRFRDFFSSVRLPCHDEKIALKDQTFCHIRQKSDVRKAEINKN